MAEKNLPWGLKNDKITPGSVKVMRNSKKIILAKV
jgi:hypothetical protein